MVLTALFIVLALGLSGCTRAPGVREPSLTWSLPEQWTAPEAVIDSFRWDGFAAAPLRELVAEVLSRNSDLRAAAGRLNAAVAQAKLAGAAKFPQVDASGTELRGRQNFIGSPIPGRASQVLSATSTNYGVSLNVSWEVDLWGKLRSGEVAALADFGAAEARFRGAGLSLMAQTARSYFAAVEATRQLQLATANLEIQEATLRQIERRYGEGLRPALDVHLARSNLALAEVAIEQHRRRLDLTTRQLEILLGRYPAAQLAAVDERAGARRTTGRASVAAA